MADLVERDIQEQETITADGVVVRRLTVHCDRHGGATYVSECAACAGCVGYLLPAGGQPGAVLCRPPGDPPRPGGEAARPAVGAPTTPRGG
ncbi:MAG: hypothetical protein JWM10_1433 [Myxococcaceae bacterium]|nr:hypothetical protein [Myxococcaceae bacterium]